MSWGKHRSLALASRSLTVPRFPARYDRFGGMAYHVSHARSGHHSRRHQRGNSSAGQPDDGQILDDRAKSIQHQANSRKSDRH